MLKKIINWFNEPLVLKKAIIKKQQKTINNLKNIVEEQADSINFLIQQLEMKKETTISQERKIKELKKQLKEVENGK